MVSFRPRWPAECQRWRISFGLEGLLSLRLRHQGLSQLAHHGHSGLECCVATSACLKPVHHARLGLVGVPTWTSVRPHWLRNVSGLPGMYNLGFQLEHTVLWHVSGPPGVQNPIDVAWSSALASGACSASALCACRLEVLRGHVGVDNVSGLLGGKRPMHHSQRWPRGRADVVFGSATQACGKSVALQARSIPLFWWSVSATWVGNLGLFFVRPRRHAECQWPSRHAESNTARWARPRGHADLGVSLAAVACRMPAAVQACGIPRSAPGWSAAWPLGHAERQHPCWRAVLQFGFGLGGMPSLASWAGTLGFLRGQIACMRQVAR